MLGRDYHCGKGSDPKPRYSHRHLTWMAQSGKNVYDSSFTSQITWRILDWGRPHVSRLTLTLLKLLLVNLKDLDWVTSSSPELAGNYVIFIRLQRLKILRSDICTQCFLNLIFIQFPWHIYRIVLLRAQLIHLW